MIKNKCIISAGFISAALCAGVSQATDMGASPRPVQLVVSLNNSYTSPLSLDINESWVTSGHVEWYQLVGDSTPIYVQDFPSSLYDQVTPSTNLNAYVYLTQFPNEAGYPLEGQFRYSAVVGGAIEYCQVNYSFSQDVTTSPTASTTATSGINCSAAPNRNGGSAMMSVSFAPA